MTRKTKKWTAHAAVKTISFILIVGLSFGILNRINACQMRQRETMISPEVIFVDLSTAQYFADQNMGYLFYYASQLVYFGSETAILNGDFLKWSNYGSDGYTLTDAFYTYGWTGDVDYHSGTSQLREQMENQAKQQELSAFRSSKEYFTRREGLVYYLAGPNGVILSNVGAEITFGWFKSQPVYYVYDGASLPEASHEYDYGLYSYRDAPYEITEDFRQICFAFTTEYIDAQKNVYQDAQKGYITDITIIAASSILILALFIILLLGAGRKQNSEGVRFIFIDKPFLDISLVVVIGWIALMIYFAVEFGNTIWQYQNLTAMNILFAALSITVISPFLVWFMSFAKRVKAGAFWRHSLIYFIPSRTARFIKSQWAGVPLTSKVGCIAFISFCLLLFTGLIGFNDEGVLVVLSAFIFTAVVTVFLLRYAKRIHTLEKAALQSSGGEYDAVIDVGKGELGSIASSINNISAGINTAVEQRMKSERLKTELITNVSHDIRTPLTSIITYIDLLKHEGLDCEKAPEYLEVLIQKSQRLKTLTDELFEAAKAATGNIDVNLAELDLVSLINQVLGELDGAIKSSGLDLRVTLPEKLQAMADGKLMWRVMENLLSNVFKYALPSSRVYLDAKHDQTYVFIELKNISATELNIDPNELTDRFKRGDDSRTDGGSGLGLSIVQSFVTAQGGKFSISIDGDLFKVSIRLCDPCRSRHFTTDNIKP